MHWFKGSPAKWIHAQGEEPHLGQWSALELLGEKRFVELICGRGWGKSRFAAWIAEWCAMAGGLVWVVSKTYELADRVFNYCWLDFERRGWLVKPGSTNSHGHESSTILLPTGGMIVTKSADHPDSLIGTGPDLIIVDEAPTLPARIWDQMLEPSARRGHGRALLIGTPRGRNYCHRISLEAKLPGSEWGFLSSPAWQNNHVYPGGRQDPEIVKAEQMAERNGLSALFWQEYGARFDVLQGRVLSKWNPAAQIKPLAECMRGVREYYGGVDWGYSTPCAVYLFGRTGDHKWRVLKEFYGPEHLPDAIVASMLVFNEFRPADVWWCGPDRPENVQLAIDADLPALPANDDRYAGRLSLIEAVHSDGFMAAEECVNWHREAESWVFRDGTDETVKENDHAMDGSRYAIHSTVSSRGEIRTAQVGWS
jgi:hypothetical protein